MKQKQNYFSHLFHHAVVVDPQGVKDGILGDLETAVQITFEGSLEVKVEEEADEALLQGMDEFVTEGIVYPQTT